MHTWTWKHVGDRAYLTCSLLDNWSHGFFTQSWWPLSPTEITPTLDPNATAYQVKQVHGNIILTPTDVEQYQAQCQADISHHPINNEQSSSSSHAIPLQSPFPQADGLCSEKSEQALWVASADCTPTLVADVATGAVAAIHAGWRGTAQKIVPKAIQHLQAHGSKLQHIRVALGPAIAGDVYQVSAAVGARVSQTILPGQWAPKVAASETIFETTSHPTNNLTSNLTSNLTEELTANLIGELADDTIVSILKKIQTFSNPPVLADDKEGHVRLDVRRVNQLQLEQLGLLPEQVAIAPYCTFQYPDSFFSYRRNRLKRVQWSGIVSH